MSLELELQAAVRERKPDYKVKGLTRINEITKDHIASSEDRLLASGVSLVATPVRQGQVEEQDTCAQNREL